MTSSVLNLSKCDVNSARVSLVCLLYVHDEGRLASVSSHNVIIQLHEETAHTHVHTHATSSPFDLNLQYPLIHKASNVYSNKIQGSP